MKKVGNIFLVFFLFSSYLVISQNQNKKWYFGALAGLDFMTSPPTVLTNGAMNTIEGCASIADGSGNILMYTDGVTVYNQLHTAMANGTGLLGNNSACQACIILKKPGSSTLYYIFTIQGVAGSAGLNYSVVDISLSSGQGSVTVKNAPLYSAGCHEKITGTQHCNGADYWILSHDMSTSVFRAHLLTSAGVNTAAVTSTLGTAIGPPYSLGCMKISPNGQKLGMTDYLGYVDLFDFDNSTGVVSNSLALISSGYSSYGCEFSPDGTKFYAGSFGGTSIKQWDLCAGSPTAIVASQYGITAGSPWSMQIATDGKIYLARNSSTLGIIDSPNLLGSSCNYINNGLSISPKSTVRSIPNYISSSFMVKPPTLPFTYTVSNSFGCQTASFTAPPSVQNFSYMGCSSWGYSLTGVQWNFGDLASGALNTSTLTNPLHSYPSLGTYTTQLILYYSCGGSNDTLYQQVNINQPCISVSSTSITCANLGSATVSATGGAGPFSYTWMPGGQTNSVATGLSPGTYTIRVFDFGNNYTYTATTLFTSLIPLTGLVNNSSSITCNGAATGTANVTNIAGGSGSQTYLWTNGVNVYAVPNPTNLTAGNYTLTVTDALTGCTINAGFFISQPQAATVSIAASSATTCAGKSVTLTGSVAGGNPGYTYTWTAGPTGFSYTPIQTLAGNYVYSLNISDASNCKAGSTITITVIANPVLNLIDGLICPLQTGTINAMGAVSYTWNGLYAGSSFTDNPLSTTQYTVVGASNGCTTVATPSIILKPLPTPTLTTNGPLCNGSSLILNANGGAGYLWNGPSGFNTALQNYTITPAGLVNAGVYNLTVTAANGCTASTSANVAVNPTPSLTASGSTICTGQNLVLSAGSVPGATFLWSGPNSFSSAQQNILMGNALNGQSGNYTITATSIFGCTNTAVVSVSVVSPPSPIASLSSNSMCAQGFNASPNAITAAFTGASSYTLFVPAYISSTSPAGPSSVLSLLPPNLNTGPVTVTLVGSNGVCTNNSSSSFTLVPNPVITLTGLTPVICAGDSFTFNANGASAYSWLSTNPANVIYTSGSSAVVSPTQTSVFSVIGTAYGCAGATQIITLTVNPLPQFTLSPNPAMLCVGSSVNLQAAGTTTLYNWSPNVFLNSTTGSTVTASPPASQNYVVLASLNSCTSSAVITVSVLPIPTAVILAPRTELCAGDSIILYGSGANTYQWKGPSNFSATGKDQGFIGHSGTYSGNYTLTVSDLNNCRGFTTQAITVHDIPQGYFSANSLEGCAPFCPDLVFKQAGGTASITSLVWQINEMVLNGNTINHCFETPGTHLITGLLNDVNGCAGTVTNVINVHPNPIADFYFSPEFPVEQIDDITFTDASKDAAYYRWEIGKEKYSSLQKDIVYTFKEPGIYPVALVVKNKLQCADTIVKVIRVYPDFAVYVPTAFTPNGDNLNETFKPVFNGAKTFLFSIFDRWGAKIFETTDITKGWDGSYKGKACKDDVYIWKLNITSDNQQNPNDSARQKNAIGQVTLYR